MKTKLAWAFVLFVLATPSFAGEIIFSAPVELRVLVSEEITRHGHQPLDASAIDDALFNVDDNLKARVGRGDFSFKLPAGLPRELQVDLREGG